ncbi:MAG: signal peptidase II [Clostridiales bacterium]|jgi:signal peptidase II|nr:signal peptidase II [Clostridiales bacterium]
MRKFNLKIDLKNLPADKKKRLITEGVIFVAFVALDWLSKLAVFDVLERREEPIEVIKNIFYLTAATNDGIAFGMFSGASRFFGVFSMLVSGLIVLYLLKNLNEKPSVRIGFSLILAGGFANGAERLVYGYVRDFLYFVFYTSFNVADACTVTGAALIIITLLLSLSDERKKERGEKDGKEVADKKARDANADVSVAPATSKGADNTEIIETDGTDSVNVADNTSGKEITKNGQAPE